MIFSEKPRTSWDEYNYSFLEVYKLKRNANKGNYDDAYKLGMYYYVIKKNDDKSIFWLKKAASGDHIEAIRELINYYLIVDSNKNEGIIRIYKDQLKEIAIKNKQPENYYYDDLIK